MARGLPPLAVIAALLLSLPAIAYSDTPLSLNFQSANLPPSTLLPQRFPQRDVLALDKGPSLPSNSKSGQQHHAVPASSHIDAWFFKGKDLSAVPGDSLKPTSSAFRPPEVRGARPCFKFQPGRV